VDSLARWVSQAVVGLRRFWKALNAEFILFIRKFNSWVSLNASSSSILYKFLDMLLKRFEFGLDFLRFE
jgi:hypothetical protein